MTRELVVQFPPEHGGLSHSEVAAVLQAIKVDQMLPGRISGPDSANLDTGIRSGAVQWVSPDAVGLPVFSHLFTLASVANEERGWDFQLDGIAQALQAVRYSADAAEHYDWHVDWGPGNARLRKITVVAHLSVEDSFEGGLLQITTGSNPISVGQAAGTVTVFPSFLMHRVTPVTAGCRLAAVCWILGPSFR